MAKTTAQLLTSIVNSKEAIRQSIVAKGQACDKDVPLSQYAGKIRSITSGTEIVVQSNADFYQCVFCADGVWSGYKAVLEDGQYHFETTITEGLKYTNVKPEVGKIYTVDALAQIAYLYDIGGTGGQCPNLSDCVTIVCPACDEKFCKTHETHECEDDGGDNNKKCPELPTCAPVNCATCGKEYCTTHQQHECDNDDDDNPNPNPNPDPNPKPAECPYGKGCITDICTVCSTPYCTVHGTHECTQAECPKGPNCMPTACGCGASYCATHQSHPTNVCCANNTTCNYVTCTTCSTTYCTKHGTHTSAQCCPNSTKCHVVECESTQCANTFCVADHASGRYYDCSVCGAKFCSKDCYMTHTCQEQHQCSESGCSNNAYQKCVECEKYFCLDHLKNHEHGEGFCQFEGCVNPAQEATCVACGLKVCAEHYSICSECKQAYCSTHFSSHSHVDECDVDGCTNRASYICSRCSQHVCENHYHEWCETCHVAMCSACYNTHSCVTGEKCARCNSTIGVRSCALCGMFMCNECINDGIGSECAECNRLICSTCMTSELHTCGTEPDVHCHVADCTAEGIQQCHAGCGTWTCNGHGAECSECNGLFCPTCYGEHSHETVNKCPVADCQSPGVVSCTCGTYYCDWHKQYQPYSCETCGKTVCENCVESHECITGGGCEVSGCNNTDVGYCGNCEKHICASHANECEACGSMIFCPDCWAEHEHNTENTCEVDGCSGTIVSNCADCGKQLCSDHRMVCETCDAPPLCPDCWSPHNHDTESKCCISGCTSEGTMISCPNCGTVYCDGHWGAYTTQCSECQTQLCSECASSHECATAKCMNCGTTENLNWVCPVCGSLECDNCTDNGMVRACLNGECSGDLVQR